MEQLSNYVFKLNSSSISHCFLIRGEKDILIDTGMPMSAKAVWSELKENNITSLDAILLTHHDIDHVGSAYYISQMTNAPVYISKEDYPYLTRQKNRPGRKHVFEVLLRIKTPKNIKIFDEKSIYGVEIIPTPGHTPGHTAFLYDGVMFVGDLFQNKNNVLESAPKNMTVDHSENAKSLISLLNYDCDLYALAHGNNFYATKQNKEKLKTMYEKLLQIK